MAQNRTWTITQSDVSRTFTISPGVGQTGPAGPNNITTATDTDITGILKGDGANVSAAVEDTDYQGVLAEGAFVDGDKTKLDGIEAGADITDAANVDAAGAVMESDYSPAHSVLAQQSGTGSPSSVTLGTNSLLGRASGAGTAIQGLTAAQARTLLNVEDGATADQTAAEILTAIKTVDGTGSGLDADLLDGQEATAFATSSQGALADSAVQPGDIDTLAELNAIITDATLIDTTDSRLSDARTPTAHTHTASDLDFAGSTDIGADLADADEVLVSDGGGNTTRVKSALSRFWTYIKAKIESVGLSSLNISGNLTVDTDTLHVDSTNNRVGIGTASPNYPTEWAISESGYSTMIPNGAYHGYRDFGGTARTLVGSSGDSVGIGGVTTSSIVFTSSFAESGRFDATGLQVATGNNIRFADNSGTWDGATISGNQSFSGQVELTGQAASTDDSAMTRLLTMQQIAMSPNIQTYPAFFSTASGTGASHTLNLYGLGYPLLVTGTAAGSYAYARFSYYGENDGSGAGTDFSNEFWVNGWFRCSMGATGEGVHRFLMGSDGSPTELADQDAFTDEGLGFEIRGSQGGTTGTFVRLIYHDGTSYKQSSWVSIIASDSTFVDNFQFALYNAGDGNVSLYVSNSGNYNAPQSLVGASPVVTISDGPTTYPQGSNSYTVWQTCNDSTAYTASIGSLAVSPIRLVTNP